MILSPAATSAHGIIPSLLTLPITVSNEQANATPTTTFLITFLSFSFSFQSLLFCFLDTNIILYTSIRNNYYINGNFGDSIYVVV